MANYVLLSKFNNVSRWFLGIRFSKRVFSFKQWLLRKWIKAIKKVDLTWFDSYNALVSNYNYTKAINNSLRIFGGKNFLFSSSSYIEELYIFDVHKEAFDFKMLYFNFVNRCKLFLRTLYISEVKRRWTYFKYMERRFFTDSNFLKYNSKSWYFKRSFLNISFSSLCLRGDL